MSLSKLILVLGILSFTLPMNAQLTGTHLLREIQYNNAPGKVTIIQNPNITKLIDKHLYEESKKPGIKGCRIRLFADSGPQARKEGEQIQGEFMNRFPDMPFYYGFQSPWYYLYMGDFRTGSEAMKILKQIDKYYPDAYIVYNVTIEYPKH